MRDPVFEGIEPEELEQPVEESRWRRPFFILVGIFLAFLVFSLSFSDFLQSVVQSKPVREDRLVFPGAIVIFTNDTLELLQDEFITNEHREIKACLFGEQKGADYIISRVEFPEVLRASVVHVSSVPCPEDVLIDLHSHPINRCLASEPDVAHFEVLKARNPAVRMMIMCSSNRFAIV